MPAASLASNRRQRIFTVTPGFALACALIAGATGVARAADAQCQRIEQRFHSPTAGGREHYGMAFCAARAGRSDEAFAYLASAVQHGYHDGAEMKGDKDFDSVRADARWEPALAAVIRAEQAYRATINTELLDLYNADQADRRAATIDWDIVAPRDRARERRVSELVAAGALRHSDDFYRAALIYQHGPTPDFHLQAHRWSMQALALDPTNSRARWLACASEDRYLHGIGKPQIWGTQFSQTKDRTGWTMEPWDRSQKTDAQRREMNVPSEAETLARLAAMNAAQAPAN